MNKFLLPLVLMVAGTATAQTKPAEAWMSVYRASETKVNNLVHTKLDVRFDYAKAEMPGKAWITLTPHFYPTDSLRLDAKGMQINRVALMNGSNMANLTYRYDSANLFISLPRTYRQGERYTVYIDYVSRPNLYKGAGSVAITDAKGLYFINPDGKDKNKPTQIWTQGETEGSSVWFPTIDRPNQKTTQEISMTVPAKYVTLSNGKLMSQKKNADGTRTDNWKMDLPHTPYLFFMGVGDFAVIKDAWKGKEVSYYVEPEYGPVARKIFGNTPEMMTFFSRLTGVEYPWIKYSQLVGQDYVSGAMENTTATIHQASAQQDARQLTEKNGWESTIAHELFHHWFGDYVTCESWSNLTVNESFANYSEYLWLEYKYGKDAADEHNYDDMRGYLGSGSEKKKLVRFHYKDKEDMFDAVSYNKGGRILHMLRHHLGDSAFFRGINRYLSQNKFGTGEAHQLRLAMEEVSGMDLNWFFNQWYFGAGHPRLGIDYEYMDNAGMVKVKLKQTQSDTTTVFRLPMAIDVYEPTGRKRYNVVMTNRTDSFMLPYSSRPWLVNVDAEKLTLASKTDNKTLDQYLYQYKNARNYMDRLEAVQAAAKKQSDKTALEILRLALQDKFHGLRLATMESVDMKKENIRQIMTPVLMQIARNDEQRLNRAEAINMLSDLKLGEMKAVYEKAALDSSYALSAAGLNAINEMDTVRGYQLAQQLNKQKPKFAVARAINNILMQNGDFSGFAATTASFKLMGLQEQFEMLESYGKSLALVTDVTMFQDGVDAIKSLRESIPAQYRKQTDGIINRQILGNVVKAKNERNEKALADYAQAAIDSQK